jgi:hypothetical protein
MAGRATAAAVAAGPFLFFLFSLFKKIRKEKKKNSRRFLILAPRSFPRLFFFFFSAGP